MTNQEKMPNTSKNDQPPLSAKQLFLLIGSIIAGVALAQFAAPYIFSNSPTDLNRNKYLIEVLSSPEHQPKYVVLGNSIAMAGIDTRIISEKIPSKPLGYNLATTGQGLTEANIFFSVLPESVQTVVHVFYVNQLSLIDVINEQKFNALYMFGARPNNELNSILIDIYGERSKPILNQSYFEQAFNSRWAVRQALDTFMRNNLRKDLSLKSAVTDLYFPSINALPLPENKLIKNLEEKATDTTVSFPVYAFPQKHLDSFITQVKNSGRRYILVIAPLNPRTAKYNPPDRIKKSTDTLKNIANSNNVILIDAIQLLDATDFTDALHPTREGAAKLSLYIGEKMAERSSAIHLQQEGAE